MPSSKIILGDCLEELKNIPGESVHAIVTDPPYGLAFMGKKWDCDVPSVEVWRECLRALKPGGHLLSFAGTRTQHRMCVNIEDAGFEIRDMIAWVYGNGFPKSRNLNGEWQGWGTALKPAMEPITVARKPPEGTVAVNVQEHGTGALNVDGCRIENKDGKPVFAYIKSNSINPSSYDVGGSKQLGEISFQGRWPANFIHDGSDETMDGLGPASRFFYCAKASQADRDDGNNHPTVKPTSLMRYLCRLVTPLGGTVLDPFCGSGSTGKAAVMEGFNFIGIERESEYVEIAKARIAAIRQGVLL
jgi:site-specific DNA-methyltransferase (adenine-specific)